MSRVIRKPALCTCGNKAEDQLRDNRAADQILFSLERWYNLSTSLIRNFKPLAIFSGCTEPGCVRPGWKPRRQEFSWRGSNGAVVNLFYFMCCFVKNWIFQSKRLETYKNLINRFSLISRWSKYLKNTRDDWEVRRLLPENDNVTIYTLNSFMLLKVVMFCPRYIDIK